MKRATPHRLRDAAPGPRAGLALLLGGALLACTPKAPQPPEATEPSAPRAQRGVPMADTDATRTPTAEPIDAVPDEVRTATFAMG